MRTFVESMIAAQPTLLQRVQVLPEQQATLERLRAQLPAPVLAHFLRLVAQGHKGAAVVRNGVCTACHIRLSSGIAAALIHPTDLNLCETCGAYLMLAPEDMPVARAVPVVEVVKRRRAPQHAAVAV